MRSKAIVTFLKEPQMLIRFALVVTLFFITFVFKERLKAQQLQLRELREKKQFIANIPQLEDRIQQIEKRKIELELSQHEKTLLRSSDFNLSGIFIEKDDTFAIINEEVYRVGDNLGYFKVYEIHPDSVILLERNTGRTLFLMM